MTPIRRLVIGVSQTSLPGTDLHGKKKSCTACQYILCEKYVDTLAVQSAMTVIKFLSETIMHDTCKRLCIIMAYFF